MIKPDFKELVANLPSKLESKKTGDKAGEITLEGVIGDDYNGLTAKQFRDTLKGLGPVKMLDIYLNSVGGSVTEGFAIYNELVRHPARKRIICDMALSMASVILQAADERQVFSTSWLMIHRVQGFAIGSADDLVKVADIMKKSESNLRDVFTRVTGMDSVRIAKLMDEETWYNGQEIVDSGFADKVVTPNAAMSSCFTPFDKGIINQLYESAPSLILKARNPKPRLEQFIARNGSLFKLYDEVK